MGALSVEKERALKGGDKKVSGFTGAVRSLDSLTVELGDTFTLPDTYEVFEQKFGKGDSANTTQYIFVECGKDNFKKFYPSTFTKSRAIYDEDGTPTGERAHTKGTAAELYRQSGSVAAGMDALKGKTLKVTDMVTVRTLKYGSTEVVNALIPTIDIVK